MRGLVYADRFPAGVHVHTCSDRVLLVGLKLSLLNMSAQRFQDKEAQGVAIPVYSSVNCILLPYWLGHLHYHRK